MKRKSTFARLCLIASMFIFGTIGIFRNYITLPDGSDFPSGALAFIRAAVGAVFLLVIFLFKKNKTSIKTYARKIPVLFITGAIIGFNWILLFEAVRTSVVIGTLCYYMAPVIVTAVSPFIFKEKLTLGRGICMVAALVGVVLVSGITGGAGADASCVMFGLGAAVLYSAAIVLNKLTPDVPVYEKTIIQMFSAALVVLPYTLLTENVPVSELFSGGYTKTLVLLAVVGIVHTGIAYALYFGSIPFIKAQTVALFSYIDPVVAILLSALILKEKPGIAVIIGACLILGSTFVSEFVFSDKTSE